MSGLLELACKQPVYWTYGMRTCLALCADLSRPSQAAHTITRHGREQYSRDLTLPKVVQGLAARLGCNIPAHKVINHHIPAWAIGSSDMCTGEDTQHVNYGDMRRDG